MTGELCWILLTQGTRSVELRAAVDSLRSGDDSADIVVVSNGGTAVSDVPGARVVRSETNLGVPGGRALGVDSTDAPIIGFLDDDARLLTTDASALLVDRFDRDPRLGAVGFRIVDEVGSSSRRHVPRVGGGSADRAGQVATFLGGASVIRRSAYDAAGGYWNELFYAHEELDLAWRLHDAGFDVVYEPQIEVFHPRTSISRHADGWRLTGRNRVMIARRDLPWPVALIHVTVWLVLGWWRAPDAGCRSAYWRGWRSGWAVEVERRPISWRTVARLSRRGRPPIV